MENKNLGRTQFLDSCKSNTSKDEKYGILGISMAKKCQKNLEYWNSKTKNFHFFFLDTYKIEIDQGRKKAMRILKNMLEERRAKPKKIQTDFFDYVLEELQRKDTVLTEEIALDLMFVLLFASFETTSLALTLATKVLAENPLVLKELTVSEDKSLR